MPEEKLNITNMVLQNRLYTQLCIEGERPIGRYIVLREAWLWDRGVWSCTAGVVSSKSFLDISCVGRVKRHLLRDVASRGALSLRGGAEARFVSREEDITYMQKLQKLLKLHINNLLVTLVLITIILRSTMTQLSLIYPDSGHVVAYLFTLDEASVRDNEGIIYS